MKYLFVTMACLYSALGIGQNRASASKVVQKGWLVYFSQDIIFVPSTSNRITNTMFFEKDHLGGYRVTGVFQASEIYSIAQKYNVEFLNFDSLGSIVSKEKADFYLQPIQISYNAESDNTYNAVELNNTLSYNKRRVSITYLNYLDHSNVKFRFLSKKDEQRFEQMKKESQRHPIKLFPTGR
ncbi:hypothetical protein ACTHGU_04745 [Chitinophagaceae bacterium MMS25-I14]